MFRAAKGLLSLKLVNCLPEQTLTEGAREHQSYRADILKGDNIGQTKQASPAYDERLSVEMFT